MPWDRATAYGPSGVAFDGVAVMTTNGVEPLNLVTPTVRGLYPLFLALDVLVVPAAIGVAVLALMGAVVLRGPLAGQLEFLPALRISAHWHILNRSIASFISNAISILSLTILMPLGILLLYTVGMKGR